MSLTKTIVIFDEDVDVQNENEAYFHMFGNVDWSRDVIIQDGMVDALDHASYNFAFGGKIGIDATRKLPAEGYTRGWPTPVEMSESIKERVSALEQLRLRLVIKGSGSGITSSMPDRRIFLLILLIYLALAIGYSVAMPLGEAPDEADHFAYIRYIGENQQLPEGPRVTQGKHPPFYHAAVAALTAGVGQDTSFLRSNPDAFPLGPDAPPNFFIHTTLEAFPWQGGAMAMHLGRFLSIVLGAVTLWATWRIGVEAFPQYPEIGLLAAAFLAGLPAFLFISASINNDNAAGAFGALVLLLCIQITRRGLSLTRIVLLGILMGFGLLSKVGTLALWPLVAVAAVGAIWPERTEGWAWLKAGAYALLAWGIGAVIASPWMIRNILLYGDPLGWKLVDATIDVRTGPVDGAVLLWLFRGLYTYFWGRFGAIGQVRMPEWFYIFAGVISIALLAGAIYWLLKNQKRQSRFSVLLLALAPLFVLLSIVRYTAIALGTDQARLMWPAIGAVAVWVGIGVLGLAQWSGLSKRIRTRNTGGRVCGCDGDLRFFHPGFGCVPRLCSSPVRQCVTNVQRTARNVWRAFPIAGCRVARSTRGRLTNRSQYNYCGVPLPV